MVPHRARRAVGARVSRGEPLTRPSRRGCAATASASGVTEVSIDQLGARRRLVGVADAGELGDLAGPRPGVEALDVALLAHLERRGEVHEHEPAVLLDQRAGLLAGGLVGRDRGDDDGAAVLDDLAGHPADAAMLRSRCSREKESSLDRWVRTTSPSSTVTGRPSASSWATSASATVDLPAPDRPVRKTVTPGAGLALMPPVCPRSGRRRAGCGRGCPSGGPGARRASPNERQAPSSATSSVTVRGQPAGDDVGERDLLEHPPVGLAGGDPDAGQRGRPAPGYSTSSGRCPCTSARKPCSTRMTRAMEISERRQREPVAALPAALAGDQPGVLQVAEDGLEEAGRDALRRRDGVAGERARGPRRPVRGPRGRRSRPGP